MARNAEQLVSVRRSRTETQVSVNRVSEEQSSEVLFFFRGFPSVVLRWLSPPGATAFAQRAPSAGPRPDRGYSGRRWRFLLCL